MKKINKKIKEIEIILKGCKPLLKKEFKVKEIGIFGSYLRKEQRERSDLDVLVEFSEDPSLFEFLELEDYLSKILKVRVDLVMKSVLKPFIGKRILEEVMYL